MTNLSQIALPHVHLDGQEMRPFLMAYSHSSEGEPRRAAIQIWSDEGPFMKLTTNLEEANPGEWAVWVKTWAENAPYAQAFIDQCPWIQIVGSCSIGRSTAALCEINPGLLPQDVARKIEEFMGWDVESFGDSENRSTLREVLGNA